MKLCVIMDLNDDNYKYIDNPEIMLNNLIVFLNAYQKCSMTNQILFINNKTTFFDSHLDDLKNLTIYMKNWSSNNAVVENDIGYTLLIHKPQRILVIDYNSSYNDIKLLKIAFSCQKLGIRIDCISQHSFFKQVCKCTEGLFSNNGSIDYFLNLLSNQQNLLSLMEVRCICHNKTVRVGVVCPVCLSVFCKFVPICKKCKIKIEFSR